MEARQQRREKAEQLAPYFEVQLLLANHVAGRSAAPLADAVASCTNLHRRFGYGTIGVDESPPAWFEFLDAVESATTVEDRVRCAVEAYVAGRDQLVPAGRELFGCFGFDPPDDDGAVRLHFFNRDAADGVGPLAASKADRRRAELTALTRAVLDGHSTGRYVLGGSWLYHLDAYCRLFPPAYVASRTVLEPVRMNGTSSWGQLLDHQERVKPHVRDAVIANLAALEPSAPWRVFPLRPLRTSAPIENFAAWYEVR